MCFEQRVKYVAYFRTLLNSFYPGRFFSFDFLGKSR